VECGVWSVECGVWSVECGVWDEGTGRCSSITLVHWPLTNN